MRSWAASGRTVRGPSIDVYCTTYARDGERDRSYSTAMCVLSLEVYYRYYLPLLKVR